MNRDNEDIKITGNEIEIEAGVQTVPPKLLEILFLCGNNSWFRTGITGPYSICQQRKPALSEAPINPLNLRFEHSKIKATLMNSGSASAKFGISLSCGSALAQGYSGYQCVLPPHQSCDVEWPYYSDTLFCSVTAQILTSSSCWSGTKDLITASIAIPPPQTGSTSLPSTITALLVVCLSLVAAFVIIGSTLWILSFCLRMIKEKREKDSKKFVEEFFEKKLLRKPFTNDLFKANENEGTAF